MEAIYLDAAATTPVKPQVAEVVKMMMTAEFGNPSSLHGLGVKAEKEVKKARSRVAKSIKARENQIIFASGGTEANNLAISGLKKPCGHAISTQIEHPSVLEVLRKLEEQDQRVDYLGVDFQGYIDFTELEEKLTSDTRLVSIALVNNEIGTIPKLDEIIKITREKAPRALIHTDAVQAWGKYPLDVQKLRVDALTLSAHKMGGPKGVGALFIRRPELLNPLLQGGGQEDGLRSGTENTPGIVGMGVAATLLPSQEKMIAVEKIKEKFYKGLKEKWPKVKRIGPGTGKGAPHILNLSFPGFPAQVLVQALSEEGVYVSAGSACSSRNEEVSYVLEALGLEANLLRSAVRFSFPENISTEDAQEALRRVSKVIKRLEKVMVNV